MRDLVLHKETLKSGATSLIQKESGVSALTHWGILHVQKKAHKNKSYNATERFLSSNLGTRTAAKLPPWLWLQLQTINIRKTGATEIR